MITIADAVTVFASSFFTVFLLGIQSRNINQSRYMAAVLTSFGISIANFTFIKYVAAGSYLTFVICATGGCMGVAFSIWFYKNIIEKKRKLACC